MTVTSAVPASEAPGRLPQPARYFPLSGPRYEVKVGLHRLGTDFGNGAADARVFQLDRDWPAYRRAKLQARAERLDKYVCRDPRLGARAVQHLTEYLLIRLPREHPAQFRREPRPGGGYVLHCALSGERLVFDRYLDLAAVEGPDSRTPGYGDGLDALACQIQEDLAVGETAPESGERLTYLHLCCPNYWAAEAKIGGSFLSVHRPVPHFDRIGRQAGALIETLSRRGPFVRFTWGITTDPRLNHHPQPPAGADPAQWNGRRFDPQQPRLYLRVERQVNIPLSKAGAFAFTIRTYLREIEELGSDRIATLAGAIASMTADSLHYKGLASQRQAILAWLQTL
ncbi:MAG: DUF3445 domain-containing protein [Gammaproteobacteria bacterium]